jgi:AraC-like DNA-binding protein
MPYYQFQPNSVLAPFIESIDVQEVLDSTAQLNPTRVLPNTGLDLAFCYGDPFLQQLHKTDGAGAEEIAPDAVVLGQLTRPLDLRATGATGILIVRCFPWGLRAFTQAPLDELTNKCEALEFLFPRDEVNYCLDRIRRAQTATAKVKVVQSFLMKQIDRVRIHDRMDELVYQAATQICGTHGNLAVTGLARQLRLSRRQLDRRFLRVVGVSPKRLVGIVRFQKSLRFHRQGFSGAEVAQFAGYFDQSHMSKDYHRFADCSVSQIFAGLPATPLMTQYNQPRLSQFYNTRYLQ